MVSRGRCLGHRGKGDEYVASCCDLQSLGGAWLDRAALVSCTPGLSLRRRGQRLLMIEPDSASWVVLEGPCLEFWQLLRQPLSWYELSIKQHVFSVAEREGFLLYLFRNGMIRVNGRSYFSGPLWPPVMRYPCFLCLHLTESCNFACKYCMADSKPNLGTMPIATAEKILYRCLHELPSEGLTIDFHGGEPLLAWEAIRHCVDYANMINERDGLNKTLWFFFQTNGSLLTEEIVRGCVERKIMVGVSMDGPRSVHDRNRIFAGGGAERGTFDVVREKVQMARKFGLKTGLLGVIHDPADYLPAFRFMTDEMGYDAFRLNYSSYIGRSARLLDFPVERAEAFAHAWLDLVDAALAWSRQHEVNLDICDINNQINNLIRKDRPFMCYRSPCGAGNSVFGFAIDGGIHACEEMASSGACRLGSIFDESQTLTDIIDNNELAIELKKRCVDNIPRCSRCPIRRFCFGGCTSRTLALYGTFMRESPMCGFFRLVFVGMMWRLYENPDMVKRLGGKNLQLERWPAPWVEYYRAHYLNAQ